MTTAQRGVTDPAPGSRCVILFAKAPVPGQVKTRLTPPLSPHSAALLYRSFIADIGNMLGRSPFPVRIYFDPPDRQADLTDLMGQRYPYFPQTGNDLGERMANALDQTLDAGFSGAVLIGTDIPDLPESILSDALSALAGSPTVIGPGMDGGYYLIGFTKSAFRRELFDNIGWGTRHVYEQTLSTFARLGITPRILPPWRDIDTFDDLIHFIHKNAATPQNTPNTVDCLDAMGLWKSKMTAQRGTA